MRVSKKITTSSTRTTGSNERKRTYCSFRTKPHPAVAVIHSTNEQTNDDQRITIIVVLSVFKQQNSACMRTICIITTSCILRPSNTNSSHVLVQAHTQQCKRTRYLFRANTTTRPLVVYYWTTKKRVRVKA